MNPEEDRLDYVLRRVKRRARGTPEQISPLTISPVKPQKLIPQFSSDKPVAAGFTLSRLPFFRRVSDYGLLELACLSGFLHKPPPHLQPRVERFSRREDFLRFTKDNVPVLLLQLRNRYKGKAGNDAPAAGAEAVFLQFAETSRALENDKDVGAVVSRLREGPKLLDEAVAAFGNPDILLPSFIRHGKRSPLSECVSGIAKLRRFTTYLDGLLTRLSDQPTFARSLWSYHHFWLGNTAVRFDDVLERAGKELTRWVKPDPKVERAGFRPDNPLEGAVASARRFQTGSYFHQ